MMAYFLQHSPDLACTLFQNAVNGEQGRGKRFEVWNALVDKVQKWWDREWEALEKVKKDLDELHFYDSIVASSSTNPCALEVVEDSINPALLAHNPHAEYRFPIRV